MPVHDHLADVKVLVERASVLLKEKPQLVRSLVYDLMYNVDVLLADMNQVWYELSHSHVILDEQRMKSEGEFWQANPQSYQWKFTYLVEEDDDHRGILSELLSIKESRELLSSLKWELKQKRDIIIKLLEKEV